METDGNDVEARRVMKHDESYNVEPVGDHQTAVIGRRSEVEKRASGR